MSLNNPASRSAMRAIVFAIVVLALLAFAYIFSFRLTTEAGLREVIRYAFMILLVSTFGYITETGIRSIKAKTVLGEVDMNAGDAVEAAQKVADDVKEKADESVEEVKGS